MSSGVRFWSRSGVTGGVSGGVSGVRVQSAVVGMSRAARISPGAPDLDMSGESVQNFAPARGDASRRVTEIFTGGSREGDENFLVASPKSLRRRKNLREKICAGRVPDLVRHSVLGFPKPVALARVLGSEKSSTRMETRTRGEGCDFLVSRSPKSDRLSVIRTLRARRRGFLFFGIKNPQLSAASSSLAMTFSQGKLKKT